MRTFLHSQIHKPKVTESDPAGAGGVIVDEALLEKADIRQHEKVLLVDHTSGARLETYALRGARNSGVVSVGGGAAREVQVGDEVVLMTFHLSEDPVEPRCVLVDGENRFVQFQRDSLRTVPAF